MFEPTDATINSFLEGISGHVVVVLWARGCRPCVRQITLLTSLAPRYNGRATFILVDKSRCAKFVASHEVTVYPTLLVVKASKVVATLTGKPEESAVTEFLDSALKK